ncbi:MAG: cobamide remodeling phosphodiesterase CbiR, partial [Desulfobacterales bacterium]
MTSILTASWKSRYPFSVGAPSFIIPADYLPNVAAIGPHLDHVELLFLESREESMPPAGTIRDLARLAADLDIRYSVHLPVDLYLGGRDRPRRQRDVRVLTRLLARLAPLSPPVLVLHLNPPTDVTEAGWEGWRIRCRESIRALPPREGRLAIENLVYPFSEIDPRLVEMDLWVCMDVGHLVRTGGDLGRFFSAYETRVASIHLQGANRGQDHLPLGCLDPDRLETLRQILHRFKGLVTMEVFDSLSLRASLDTLDTLMT